MAVKKPFAETVRQGFEGRALETAEGTPGFEDDAETVSHAVRLHKKRKAALTRIFKGMGMDLGTGIRMVVYQWLDEQRRK
ncbi:MAG: hypothetical protein ACLQIJ_01250 [Polyangia bacterium]